MFRPIWPSTSANILVALVYPSVMGRYPCVVCVTTTALSIVRNSNKLKNTTYRNLDLFPS
jgi:hypothetical protein